MMNFKTMRPGPSKRISVRYVACAIAISMTCAGKADPMRRCNKMKLVSRVCGRIRIFFTSNLSITLATLRTSDRTHPRLPSKAGLKVILYQDIHHMRYYKQDGKPRKNTRRICTAERLMPVGYSYNLKENFESASRIR